MPDFGKAGTITIRSNRDSAIVRVSDGEYLNFKLTAQGGIPIFTFACAHRPLLSATPTGPQQQVYEWAWCRNNPEDSDNRADRLVVSMAFTAAVKYTLVVEHRRRDDSLVKKLKDIDYESQDPLDDFTEGFDVTVR